MYRLSIHTASIFLLSVCCFTQVIPRDDLHISEPHAHTASKTAVISGAEHPEMIPDSIAYRLFFLSIPLSAETSNGQHAPRVSQLQNAGLSINDADAFVRVLREFKTEYGEFIKKYNEAAEIAFKEGKSPDSNSLLSEREAIVQRARDGLKRVMTPQGMSQLDLLVKAEKRNMTISAERRAKQ